MHYAANLLGYVKAFLLNMPLVNGNIVNKISQIHQTGDGKYAMIITCNGVAHLMEIRPLLSEMDTAKYELEQINSVEDLERMWKG